MTLLAALATCVAAVSVVRADSVPTRIGALEFRGSYPSEATITKLHDERDFQRATQAYLWALPIVGMANWQKAHEEVWVQSLPGKSWFSYFRLYGPTEPFFDRSWVLDDFEEVN